jgi:hypothetical protein
MQVTFTLTGPRLSTHLALAPARWTVEIAAARLFAIESILDLYRLPEAAQNDLISSLTSHAQSIRSYSYFVILDILGTIDLKIEHAATDLLEDLAYVRVFGQHLLECLCPDLR